MFFKQKEYYATHSTLAFLRNFGLFIRFVRGAFSSVHYKQENQHHTHYCQHRHRNDQHYLSEIYSRAVVGGIVFGLGNCDVSAYLYVFVCFRFDSDGIGAF